MTTNAQTYLEHLQASEAGKGKVTVHETSELDLLVNGIAVASTDSNKPTAQKPTAKPSTIVNDSVAVEQTDAPKTGVARKMQGYRIQVYAGGNTRNDKAKAESIGGRIRASFPSEAVYVHFSSPRWICRMGNYKTYDEAMTMLNRVRAAGFNQASLVKGTITVTD